MNLDYRSYLPETFGANSRVWVYQSNRLLSLSEALHIEQEINNFTESWQSHGAEVNAYGNLFFGQFLVLMADEHSATVSGCSTDASVRFVKELGNALGIDFFNRTNLAFFTGEKIQTLPLGQLSYAFENGFLTPDTLYFNNLVQTRAELEDKWIIPVKDSWLAGRLPLKKEAGS